MIAWHFTYILFCKHPWLKFTEISMMMGRERNHSKMNCNVKNYKLKLILKGVTFHNNNFSKCQKSSFNNYGVYTSKLREKGFHSQLLHKTLRSTSFFYDHINPTLHWVSGKLWRMLNLMHAIGILQVLWCFICEKRIGLLQWIITILLTFNTRI
jgi:hypothetical protein